MSRFADPDHTVEVHLREGWTPDAECPGCCECPPRSDGSAPHEHDIVTVRDHLSQSELLRVAEGTTEQMNLKFLVLVVKGWNLVDEKGKAVAVDAASINDLSDTAGTLLATLAQEAISRRRELPNPYAGTSPAS